MLRFISVFILIIASATLFAQQQVKLKEIAKLPKVLHETSGLIVSKEKIWSHNDSRGEPVLYGLDKTGKITDAVYLRGHNTDWEDLAPDDDGNFYVGDFGNQDNNRRDLKIYKIPNPATIKDKFFEPQIINFSYPDQVAYPPQRDNMNFDMEAMICFNGSIYLFSKNRTEPFNGYTKMYKLPQAPGTYVAELIDSIYLGPEPMITSWVTGADISPDKKKLVLLGHQKLWLFTCFQGDDFFSGEMTELSFPSLTQKEGVSFIDNNSLYITDELVYRVLGGKLYYLDLAQAEFPCK